MAGVANLFNESTVVFKNGKQVDLKAHCAGKIAGIYFSAHWCPPCRGFTPILAEFYNKHKESKNFEIIFVSSDSDEASFKGYFNEMPWLALEFKYRDKKELISNRFQVEGIPSLVLLNADTGDVYTDDARSSIQFEDREGRNFPWQNKLKAKRSGCVLL